MEDQSGPSDLLWDALIQQLYVFIDFINIGILLNLKKKRVMENWEYINLAVNQLKYLSLSQLKHSGN